MLEKRFRAELNFSNLYSKYKNGEVIYKAAQKNSLTLPSKAIIAEKEFSNVLRVF